MGYRPSVLEQTKFDYSPLVKVFKKELDEDDKKELFMRLRNIEDKNEKLIQLFSKTSKITRLQKMKVIIITTINMLSTSFTETLKTLENSHWCLNTAT